MKDQKINQIEIFAGHFGSGKTEIVLNRAMYFAERGEAVSVIDLDLVKPYFRSREARGFLKDRGINLIMPENGLQDADLPIVSPSILGVFTSAKGKILVDVGGDALGATALGYFAPILKRLAYTMFFVINPYRPFTGDIFSSNNMLREIETVSRLKVSYLVSNPNLGRGSQLEDIEQGFARVQEFASETDIPIAFNVVSTHLAHKLKVKIGGKVMPIKNYLLPPWEMEEEEENRC